MQRICLWSGPRNVSTALMYSFAQRGDTKVIDEPLYAHYLAVTGAGHPGREEVLSNLQKDAQKVIEEVILADYPRPVLFIKNMAHHLIEVETNFLDSFRNVFLIRDPKEMLPSLIRKIPEPVMRDTAYRHQWELFEHLTKRDNMPIILDARELLLDPQGVLQHFCKQLDISFENTMLEWKAGPIPEDGVWAKHWYHNVHQSTGFKPYKPKAEDVPARLQPLLEECLRYYERLYEHAIKAGI